MKQIYTIFCFTFVHAAKKKAFIISTVVMILLIGVVAALPALLAPSANDGPAETQTKQRCYYVDDQALLTHAIPALSAHFETTEFIAGTASQLDSYYNEIQNSSDTSAVVITLENNRPFINVLTKDFRSGIAVSGVVTVLSRAYVTQTLEAQGVSAEAITAAQSPLAFNEKTLNDNTLSGYFIGILATMLIFFAIYFYSYGVAMSVASDKTSRVMETLVVAAKPSRILIGKCLGMGVLGLTQFFVIVLCGLALYKAFIPGEFVLFGMTIDLSVFTLQTAGLLVLYFVLGYTLYAMMHAVCGALVSKVEDLNSAMMPVTLISLASFYLGFFSASANADGMLQKIALYLPFSAPFYAPSRLLSGALSSTELAVSLGILLAAIVGVTILSMRVYTATVLSYGKGLKMKDLMRFAKR